MLSPEQDQGVKSERLFCLGAMTRNESETLNRFNSFFSGEGKSKVVQTPALKLGHWLCFFLVM